MLHEPRPCTHATGRARALTAPLSSAAGRTCQGEGGELSPKALPQRACAAGVMILPLEHPVFTRILIFIIKSFSSLTFMQLNPSITSYTLRPGAVFLSYLPKIRDELISVQFSTNFFPYCQKSKADYVAIMKMFIYQMKRPMHLRYFAEHQLQQTYTLFCPSQNVHNTDSTTRVWADTTNPTNCPPK